MEPTHAAAPAERVFRAEYGRILSGLIRLLGDFERAEEVLAETSDWPQIAALYELLRRAQPTAVVALNRAAAVAMAAGPEAGLRLIDALTEELADYHLLHSARADLLRRLGRRAEAAEAYRRALALATNDAERGFLRRRLAELEGPA